MRNLYQTPPDIPEGLTCRTFKIPSSYHWLGIFNAAVLTMLNEYNWEQVNDTDLTVEETIAIIREMIEAYWDTEFCCDDDTCLQPDGYRVLRLNLNGHIEQLGNGGWVAPTGDYEIPPTPARTEPTAAARKCAAAANAQNVLEQTYEQVTDAIAEGITVAELAVIMATELTLLLGPAFGFIVPAFIFLLEAAALAFLEIAEFMGTDVWDEEFSGLLMCALLECASDDGDVVTFDYQCIIDNLAENVDLLNPLAQSQLLLFGQVNFMLSIIGVDGLNAAGATTEVEDANCDECELEWSACFDFLVDDGEWTQAPCYTATVYSAAGWGRNANGIVGINRTFAPTRITSFGIELDMPLTGNYHRMFWVQDGDVCTDPSNEVNIGTSTEWGIFDLTGTTTSLQILFQNNTPNTSNPLNYHIVKVNVNGIGFNPFEDYPPCEE